MQNINDFLYFRKLGWSLSNIKAQAKKRSNYSIGLMKSNILIGFIIGDLIYIEKISEYEILLIYVDNRYRNKSFALYLIDAFTSSSFLQPLKKITPEVSKSNIFVTNLYIKNGFEEIKKKKKLL